MRWLCRPSVLRDTIKHGRLPQGMWGAWVCIWWPPIACITGMNQLQFSEIPIIVEMVQQLHMLKNAIQVNEINKGIKQN